MKRCAVLLVGLAVLGACSMPPKALVPDGTVVENYLGVRSEKDFWMRYMELSAQAEKVDINKLTAAYRACVAEQMADLTPANVSAAIDKFVQSDLYDDYYDAMGLVGDFARDFKTQHRLEPLYYAGDTCQAKGINPLNT